jgi:serine/threonine protein kinase
VNPSPEHIASASEETAGDHLYTLWNEIRALGEDCWDRFVQERAAGNAGLARQLRDLIDDERRTRHAALSADTQLAGRYTLKAPLGRGASGSVWRAYDAKLERDVAVKVFHFGHHASEGLRSALREAHAASHIVSEHVVRILNVDCCERGGAYIEMELCAESSGGELLLGASMANVRPRHMHEAVTWVIHAAQGMRAAHEQGVFHRDLKPDNILIRPLTRRALVTDFGIALRLRAEDRAGDDDHCPTRAVSTSASRVYAGTPSYMAPEQAHGMPRYVDPETPEDHNRLARIDVYGLGAVLYELLSGAPPYTARCQASDPCADVLAQVRHTAPAPLPRRVPGRLKRIVSKAMARDPEYRYPTCAALEADLRRYLSFEGASTDAGHHIVCMGLAARRNWRMLLPLSMLTAAALMSVQTRALRAENADLRGHIQRTSLVLQAAIATRDRVAAEGRTRVSELAYEQTRQRLQMAQTKSRRLHHELSALRLVTPSPESSVPVPFPAAAPVAVEASAPAGAAPRLARPPLRAAPRRMTSFATAVQDEVAEPSGAERRPRSPPAISAVFMEVAQRHPDLLTRLERSHELIAYCIAGKRGAARCKTIMGCPSEWLQNLASLHRRSDEQRVWRMSASGRVTQECVATLSVGSRVRRVSCENIDMASN